MIGSCACCCGLAVCSRLLHAVFRSFVGVEMINLPAEFVTLDETSLENIRYFLGYWSIINAPNLASIHAPWLYVRTPSVGCASRLSYVWFV